MSAAMAFPETGDYTTSSALGEAEISRLIKTAQAAQFVARDGVPKKTESNFKPRTLVEIAFAAEKVRQDIQTSHDQNNMSQPSISENDTSAQNRPSGNSTETGSALADQSELVTQVSQISEQQAEINALKAQQEASLTSLRADLADQQQLAEKQAYDRGVTAGIEAAKSAEPTEEERALDERRQAEHRDIIMRLEACVASVAGPDAVDDQKLATALQNAVMHLASERAGTAITENPKGISARIASLAERVKQKSETVIVALNPEDLRALTAYELGPLDWKYIADEALMAGDIRISLDAIDISDVLSPDLPQVATEKDLTNIDQDTSQVATEKDLTNIDQDTSQVATEKDLTNVDQDTSQVATEKDLTQSDHDLSQANVDEVSLDFKIVTTSTDGDDVDITQSDQDVPRASVDEVPLDFKIVTTGTDGDDVDITQSDQDVPQANVNEIPLDFKIVTTSSDEDAE